MDERVVQFRVGVMVLATLLITAILALLFGELPSIVHGSYTIYIKFPEAPRVIEDTPVRKSGIRIGWVSDVTLNDDRTVTITAEIDRERQIYHDEVCTIDSSLLGDTSLNFVRSEEVDKTNIPVKSGETLRGIVAIDPIEIITDMQGKMSEAIGSVTETSRKINHLIDLNQQNIHDVVVSADETLLSVQTLAKNANELIADPEMRKQMREAMAELPVLIRDTHETIGQLTGSIALVEKNLNNVEGFTKKLSDPELLGRLDRGTQNLDLMMGRLAKFSESLNSRDGTLGQLIHDPQLYDSLDRVVRNIDELSLQLGPIVNDVRVFTDKIARHPEMVGVRGAIRPSSGIK